MSDKELYLRAIEHYGKDMQTDVAMEEMGELIQAIVKHRRKATNENLCNVAEEIADVQIMIDQLKLIYNCESEVTSQIFFKKKRLHERILQDG